MEGSDVKFVCETCPGDGLLDGEPCPVCAVRYELVERQPFEELVVMDATGGYDLQGVFVDGQVTYIMTAGNMRLHLKMNPREAGLLGDAIIQKAFDLKVDEIN